MARTDFDTLAALVSASDTTPYQAAKDEASYCEVILPLVYADGGVEVTLDTREDEAAEAALHSDPIPGHFHYLDRGYW